MLNTKMSFILISEFIFSSCFFEYQNFSQNFFELFFLIIRGKKMCYYEFMKNSIFWEQRFFGKNRIFYFIDYLAYFHDWYGQLTAYCLIFDVSFRICRFFKKKLQKEVNTMLDSAFFYVKVPNLLIYEQKSYWMFRNNSTLGTLRHI